ncbi:MAG TPA: flavodoxin family protein [Candidatus Aminicenantes bacterium]|nr:flavodoxin family protein [Candidatus Aminicenantes bacterium]HRY65993.1 flavodoxin family protein [Candidatus Aminicenantes bacterium]HRZ72958.1 flavodoxin family protein [Candidatus Aminicenantes bacterium]
MAKTLVTYFSRTGNTKAVAEAIYEALPGDKVLRPMAEAGDPAPYQIVFAGFPVHAHSVPYPVEVFLKSIPEGKKVALFSTHGSVTGSRLSREALEYASILVAKARLIGTFSCRGKVSLKALEILTQSPEHEAWTDMAASAATHPDAGDLEDARAFARWIATLGAQGHYRGL